MSRIEEYIKKQEAMARGEDEAFNAAMANLDELDLSVAAAHRAIFGEDLPFDDEDERMISEMIEGAEDLHRLGLMSEEDLNEMKRIGGRL